MSSVLNFINSLDKLIPSNDEYDLARDKNYIKKSANIVNDALGKGADIMQMPNGDLLVTEVKMVTYKYLWNKERKRFERASSAKRVKKAS